jgi:copper transport outer membrane protein MctB
LIDFRYHLVSIIAVFLALAIGIVVGTTALNGQVLDDLRARNGAVIKDKRDLEALVHDLRTQVSRRDQFATTVGPAVLAGTLTGERVLLVTTPGASDDVVKDLGERLVQAGATPTGVLKLGSDLLDPAKSAVIDDLVARVAPPGLTLPEDSAAERAAVELAAATVTTPAADGISSDAAAKVLGGFTGADLVDVQQPAGSKSATTLVPATLAVLVTGGSDGKELDDVEKRRQQVALSLIRAMDVRSSGAVVAGPESAAATGGLIAAVRGEGALSDRVSSVDTVDSSFGAVSAVLALQEQLAGGSGRYGQGPGSEAAAPELPIR